MNEQFFKQFLLQREMYFSSCLVNEFGTFYFSKVNDPIWNFFVPNTDKFIDNISSIKSVFKKENKPCCIVLNKNSKIDLQKLHSFKPIYNETWYKFSGKEKFKTNLRASFKRNINEIKSVLFSTYANANHGFQPWGNLDKEYFDIINKKITGPNVTNFALMSKTEIMAVCSLYREYKTYCIFNLAIAPKYQECADSLEILKHVVNHFIEQDGENLYIQLPEKSNLNDYVKKLQFKDFLNVVYYKE